MLREGDFAVDVIWGRRETLAALLVGACESIVVSRRLAADQAGLEEDIKDKCKFFGTELHWVGSRLTEIYERFAGLGGFAARLRWPFYPDEPTSNSTATVIDDANTSRLDADVHLENEEEASPQFQGLEGNDDDDAYFL